MKITKVFLPGNFEDAYLYMGRLITLTDDKTLRVYSLDQMVALLERRYPDTIPVPELMFSRNDWLASALFSSMIRNESIALGILSAFDKCSKQTMEVDGNDFLLHEYPLDPSVVVYLDMLIYSGKLYLGANNGFYDVRIEWNKDGSISLGKVHKKLDAQCFNTSARYGTVNASCGEDGLFAFIDDFGWQDNGKFRTMVKLDNESLRTSWFDSDLVNYKSYDKPFLFTSSFEEVSVKSEREEREGKVLTQINTEKKEDLSYLFNNEIQFAYNYNHKFLIRTEGGQLSSSTIERPENGAIKLISPKSYGTIGRILTANPSRVGPVFETEDQVSLYSEKEKKLYPLSTKGALMVKSFPRSKRFQNTVVVTDEEGIWLIGLFDDFELERKRKLFYETVPDF